MQQTERKGLATSSMPGTMCTPLSLFLKLFAVVITSVKGKVSFAQWSITGFINHTPTQATCQGLVGKHKMNSMYFCELLIFLTFFMSFCCLFLLLRERET